ncbi:unnamed protein product [Eruca vesicaria subsp. sativa]|uniref:Uncharacterized protein n=1 Tax=Eruca vesicaria subsp. sativa TaxID=29727 RepID=A0ABC8JC24_ERUVS|nr:unnamed protein product [Eruca vesicaria subsp. sativa]
MTLCFDEATGNQVMTGGFLTGSSASHIEELIDSKIVLSMRAIYQSRIGLRLIDQDQINMAEVKYPLQHFKTFNEFFIRELKPSARPIAYMNRDDIAVCAAGCRLMTCPNDLNEAVASVLYASKSKILV